jgi:GH25 family lysozyme M1 (1,4-beta-N-acetylmuramidase)
MFIVTQGRVLASARLWARSLAPALAVVVVAASCASSSNENGAMRAGTVDVEAPAGATQAVVCGDGPTVFGVDVSEWQGSIDWGAAAASGGVVYGVARVSDGLHHRDDMFGPNIQGMRAHGILTGAYQFFEPAQDPIAQADMFVDAVNAQGGIDLPPVIDVEATGGRGPGDVANAVRAWVEHVEARMGRTAMIYTGKYFWEGQVGNPDMSNRPLWHAQYTDAACPNIASTWPRWTIWQHSSTGRVPGISGNVDVNRFNGTREQLNDFAAVGDAECVANPNFGGCNGSVITHCDESRRVSTGDCAFFGASCSTDGGTPHCVHPLCNINLGDENGTFCVDGTEKLATCTYGRYEEGDCAFFGATCSEEGGQGHCVHPYCPANLGGAEDGTFCVDGTQKLATCTLGQYAEGDCAFFGATCSEKGGAGHCVHPYCTINLDDEDGTFCLPGTNTLATCTLGQYVADDCAATGLVCAAGAAGAACVTAACAADEAACAGSGGEGEGEGEGEPGDGDDADDNGGDDGHPLGLPTSVGSCANVGDASPWAALAFVALALPRRRRR